LIVNGCSLNSLTSLERLPALEEFIHSRENIKFSLNLNTFPRDFLKLGKLSLQWTKLKDFSALNRFPDLEELDLTGNKRIDLATLPTNLYHLRKLDLEYCGLSDVSALSRFPVLEECVLSISTNLILNTIPNKLIHLHILRLESCGLGNISALTYFPQLVELDLRYNENLNVKTIPDFYSKIRKILITKGNREFVIRRGYCSSFKNRILS